MLVFIVVQVSIRDMHRLCFYFSKNHLINDKKKVNGKYPNIYYV